MSLLKDFIIGFKHGMKNFGHTITMIINSVLLSLVYLIGVGMTSAIAKVSGKKFLDLNLSKNSPTYWNEFSLKKKPIEEYYRQF
ncbi:hypothetical protein J4206_00355 [Candidatus Woesearchaeota archaeon]|nr:hypothetical protein [Candidatus Woesearchaeota archaeon]